MRFLEDGTDIPDELIRAVIDGGAIFLCGAGVSLKAGLPLFPRLTEQVYEKLGVARAEEAAERVALEREEYDRALRSLEKRTHRPRTPSRVRTAVADILKARDGMELSDHLALLHLSRDSDGRPRLLTTNFDTLFERAAKSAGLDAPSHANKSLPKPGGPRDYGIFHLHGTIGDSDTGTITSDLILTSADFGDAYLRDGWVSHYIEDRIRLNTVVLVGYSADDAAMRLLLETLDADRERFRDLKAIYAIDKQKRDSASLWKAKGIHPIEFVDYPDIYATLGEWARFALQPGEYGRARIKAILTGAAPSAV